MKDAFNKIKQLLPYCDVEVEFGKAGLKTKFISTTPNFGFLLSNCSEKYNANDFKDATKITPIPRIAPEIKGLVDIIDCEELREMSEVDGWDDNKMEMVGQKGLEINKYISIYNGQYYQLWQKNKNTYWRFPAWAVIPHIEDDTNTDEIVITKEMVGKKIKIQK